MQNGTYGDEQIEENDPYYDEYDYGHGQNWEIR